MKGYIYKITSPSGKIYIGQTVNINRRKNRYKNLNCQKQNYLYSSLLLYGFERHIFEIIEECNENILNNREIYWIEKFNSYNNGMNLTIGGNSGNTGYKHTEIAKNKIRNAKKGKSHSKKHIENLKEANKTKQPIRIDETIYKSCYEAAEKLNISRVTIRFRCLSNNKKFENYKLI